MPFCRNTGPEHQKQKRQRDGQSPRMSGQHQQADDCADPGSVAAGTQPEQAIAKTSRPSVLSKLKVPPVPGAPGKPHKKEMEVR